MKLELIVGSTVVVVFEADRAFEFKIDAGRDVKMGEAMGGVARVGWLW